MPWKNRMNPEHNIVPPAQLYRFIEETAERAAQRAFDAYRPTWTKEIAAEVVRECALHLGLNTEETSELRKDIAYLRRARETNDNNRKSLSNIRSHLVLTTIGSAILFFLSMVVTGMLEKLKQLIGN